MDTVLIDHEKRLTRLEDRFEVNVSNLSERLNLAEQKTAQIAGLTEQIADLKARIAALETAAAPAVAGSIGLDPDGA